jgi:hypothetical protein
VGLALEQVRDGYPLVVPDQAETDNHRFSCIDSMDAMKGLDVPHPAMGDQGLGERMPLPVRAHPD